MQAENDANSCYYSASHTEHTDNYYSTDEHENFLQHTKLHSSDSGADLSEKNLIEKHMESISDEYHRRNSKQHIEEDETIEDERQHEYQHERNNSLPELFNDDAHQSGWEKYWAKNGERLIWQSWIEKYIDYINPEYLGKDGIPSFGGEPSSAEIHNDGSFSAFSFEPHEFESSAQHRQTSTEIVISPPAHLSTDDLMGHGWNPLSPASVDASTRNQTHHNENDNLLSPRCESTTSSIPLTIGETTDSMTNVTRMTMSSFDFCSSRVTSESTPTSTPTDSNSISSFSESEESDNPMTTRLSADCEKLLMENKSAEHIPPPTGNDSEDYWQKRWQNHAQEMFVKNYNEFMEAHRMLQQEMSNSFKSDCGFLPGEGSGKFNKQRRRRSSGRKKKCDSLQRMVANLHLKTELEKQSQKEKAPTDGSDHPTDSTAVHSDSTVVDATEVSLMESLGLPTTFGRNQGSSNTGDGDDGDDRPENRPITLKRSHESDTEEPNVDRIKSHFELMGYAFTDQSNADGSATAGEIVYRKKHVRLHNRMLKMMPSAAVKPKHSYFDDDGNEVNDSSQQENEIVLHTSSDEDGPHIPPSARINIPFTSQLSSDANPSEENESKHESVNINLSIDQENEPNCVEENAVAGDAQDRPPQQVKKEKKKKRKSKFQSNVPIEIANDKVLKKFWYKRFSLFSMFDFGVKLDRGELNNYAIH